MQEGLLSALSADLSAFDLAPFPTSDQEGLDVAVMQLRSSLVKKWEPEGVTPAAERAALEKFREVNARMQNWEIKPLTDTDDVLLGTFDECLHQLLGWRIGDECDFNRVAQSFGVGPGNTVGCADSDFIAKLFESTLTTTSSRLLTLYRSMVSNHPVWASAERQRFDTLGVSIVEGCNLFFAPKYSHIARTCSTQPAINMLLQKGVDGFILERLREVGIDLSIQARLNQDLARQGSVDGSFATIDLTSASDCVSLALGRRLPQPLQSWVFATRTARTTYRGERIELGMVSMMGNGFTFSLQTAIFASVVQAAYALEGLPFRRGRSKNWGVFGDDIIVVAKAYAKVCRLLELLGFERNGDKSFHVGYFRESCGADWFKGYPVRGVYLRRLKTDVDRYSAINRLNRWSARHGVPLTNVVELIWSGLRSNFLVPPSEPDTCGIHVPFVWSRPRPVTDDFQHPFVGLFERSLERKFRETDEGHIDPSMHVALMGGYLRAPVSKEYQDICGPRPLMAPRTFSEMLRRLPDAPLRVKIQTKSLPWWDYLPGDTYFGISHGAFTGAVAGNLLMGG
jgi:hypothetical protein